MKLLSQQQISQVNGGKLEQSQASYLIISAAETAAGLAVLTTIAVFPVAPATAAFVTLGAVPVVKIVGSAIGFEVFNNWVAPMYSIQTQVA
jgi:hypothetical protein